MPQSFYSIHDHYISHHGIQGQKWGLRRYQNPDGTLTEEGKRRYTKITEKQRRKEEKRAAKEAKRREKIMQSPYKMYKHRHEFTDEEIRSAGARFEVEESLLRHLDVRRKSALLRLSVEDKSVKNAKTVSAAVTAPIATTKVGKIVKKAFA